MSKIQIKKECVEFISADIKKFSDVETGGVLFGDVIDGSPYIQKAIDGGKKAIRERYQFHADKDYIDMNIDMIHANTELRYIGEWHTHPQIEPQPSDQDLISLEEIAESAERYSILLIVGFIDYKITNFIDQSICIVKFPNRDDFYKIELNIID
ncbi:MAG: Mov34/MPN/PAD-1 family protein [Cyclobacteriaceae bacterium]|jgi:integrative and conjugative element protein (TIGR02256 family)|tara:strand:+ start:822 stop:1283 length:462 start_codon:yes stop_codon:yes gene_type:complete